jgi:hypothetical protein
VEDLEMVDAGDQFRGVPVVPGDMDGAVPYPSMKRRAECSSRQARVRVGRADQPQTIAGPEFGESFVLWFCSRELTALALEF